MTISRWARSPTRPPPSYHRSLPHSLLSAVSVPEGTLHTARSGWAMPWSTGSGNIRSTQSICIQYPAVVPGGRLNEKLYIHEFIDITGHQRANYMHHMTANWSPLAQEQRHQLCYGVWAVLGSTGTWPQVVNIWEEDGWDGLDDSFGTEAVGAGAQDPKLAKWWAKAAEFRRGGVDRLLVPAPWTRTITDLCADGVTGACYAHEVVSVEPGTARSFLEQVRERAIPLAGRHGWELAGAWSTAMGDDDECVLLWAIPTWKAWAAYERAQSDDDVTAWRTDARRVVRSWRRILLVDSPLSPFRTGRQPSREDRTDWEE